MSDQDAFERILASLYDAMLDDAEWPATSALIDEACGTVGNALLVGVGPPDDVRIRFAQAYYRGNRREDLERKYLETYHPIDERVPRLRQLPDSQMVHAPDLYTAEELKTSPTYNEMMPRTSMQDSVNVRLDGPEGSHITWVSNDPVTGGWESSQLALLQGLLPHIRQFVRVRQAVVSAEALSVSETGLLDNTRIGVIHLDRRGRIMEVNDRARALLRQGDAVAGRDRELRARRPADHAPAGAAARRGGAAGRGPRRQWVDDAPAGVPGCPRSCCTSNPWGSGSQTLARRTWPRWCCWSSRGGRPASI